MGSNPGSEAAGQTARSSAELQKALSDIALPALRDVLTSASRDLGAPGSEPDSVSKAFGDARTSIQQDYATQNERGQAAIKQQALQAGQGGAVNDQALHETIQGFGQNLENSRSQSLRALNFQEAQTGLSQTNQLLSSVNANAGSVLGGSLRFGQNALGSDQLLSQIYGQNQQQGAQYGALLGSAIGTVIYPGIGTALGGALGGVAGGMLGGG